MKQFLKYVFATVVGVALWTVLAVVLCVVSMIGMVASESATESVKNGSVLRIDLSGALQERSSDDDAILALFNDELAPLGLDDVLAAIDEAGKNKKVEGIYLDAGETFTGGSPAMMQELRQALQRFKDESGKWIIAYGEIYSQGAYYICSVADKVVLHQEGMLDWHGMAAQHMFFTDLMKKFGVKMQVFKVGTFKSAVEPYINTEMSEPNREQTTAYINSVWNQVLAEVGASRHLTAEALNAAADSFFVFRGTQAAVEQGLVDTLAYLDGVEKLLQAQLNLEDDDDIRFVAPRDLLAEREENDADDEIAVYYAYGEIVDIAPTQFGNSEPQIDGETTIRELKKLRQDDDIKAVVIRVNSPGGSAFASEKIWHEIELLKAEKPVVVSMGGMAASGGYYISCGANKIVAEPTTLTGSIGIFGMFPDASELLNDKLALHFDVVKTNKFADFGSMGRAMNPEECRLMQAYVERGYDLFTRRVAAGRNLTQDSVDVIGQGRVWTGEQAIKLGLVDQLGNLETAIAEAAKLADLKDYKRRNYPAKKEWIETLMDEASEDYFDASLRAGLGDFYPAVNAMKIMGNPRSLQQGVYARLPYELILK